MLNNSKKIPRKQLLEQLVLLQLQLQELKNYKMQLLGFIAINDLHYDLQNYVKDVDMNAPIGHSGMEKLLQDNLS